MYYIIFNPTAGAGRSIKVLESVEQHLKARNKPYKVAHTEYVNHAQELASSAIGKEYDGIISVGGDGTLLEIADALRDTNEILGVIPAGTGNDFRQAINVPKDPIKALDIIIDGQRQHIDIGLLNEQACFLNVAGTGFDVDVIKNTNKVRKTFTGGLAYFMGIVMSLFGYKNITLTITANGKTFERTVLLIAVANGRRYGGGLRIAPFASVVDGLFNVVIINRVPKWRILLELPKLKKGQLEKIHAAEQFCCDKITIASEDKVSLNVDGEISGTTPITMRIKQDALWVFCPGQPL